MDGCQLQEWADDTFPNFESLDGLPSILEECQLTEALLKDKTSEEQRQRIARLKILKEKLLENLENLHRFRQDYHALEDRLKTLKVPSPALTQARSHALDLRKLQEAKKHLLILSKIYDLTDRIDSVLQADVEFTMAFDYFNQLCSVVENVSIQSMDSISTKRIKLVNRQLQEIAAKKLEKDLSAIGWPRPRKGDVFDSKHLRYLFQLHALLASSGQDPGTPYAIKVLAASPGRAFKFHFSGSRETNRIDRPEWFLKYLNETLRDVRLFFDTSIQPVAGKIDSFGFFIVELCQFGRWKLQSDLPKLAASSDLLVHAIQETIKFDTGLKSMHPLSPVVQQWMGLTHVFCEDTDIFTLWLQNELKKASSKLADLVSTDRAWEVDLIGASGTLVGSNTLINLVESMTDEYRTLGSVPHRKVFFNEVQLPLLEYFVQQIRRRVQQSADVFKPIGGVAASKESLLIRLKSLSSYVSSLYHIGKWLDVWSINMVLVLEDDDVDVFEDIITAYNVLAERTQEIMIEDFLSSLKDRLWSYHPIHRRNSYPDNQDRVTEDQDISPSLTPSLELLDEGLDIFYRHLSEPLFMSLQNKIQSELKDMKKWSVIDWDLGMKRIFTKRMR